MSELIRRFETALTLSGPRNTALGYGLGLAELHRWLRTELGRLPVLADLTRKRIQSWIDALVTAGLAPRTVGCKAAAVKRFLYWLTTEEEQEVPCPEPVLRLPKIPKRSPQFLLPEEAERLIATPAQFGFPWLVQRDTFILEMLYGAGVRASELVTLRLADVRLDFPYPRDIAFYVHGKGDKWRWIVCGPTVYQAYRDYVEGARLAYLKGRDSPTVLVSLWKRPMSRGTLQRLVRRYGQLAGLKCWTHLLRHTCLTHLLWEGAELRALADLAGHDDPKTTAGYANADLRAKRRAAQHHPRFDKDHPRALPSGEPEAADRLVLLLEKALPLLERLEQLLPVLERLEQPEQAAAPRRGAPLRRAA